MKHTKDEIEIKITKKDRLYLSIILSLICVIAVVCILVPRYYQMQNQNLADPTTNNSNQTGSANSSNNNSENSNSSTANNSEYALLYSTSVINTLKTVGMPYSTIAKHLDSNNILNVSGLSLNQNQITQLEELAYPIYNTFNQYTSNGQTITTQVINSDNALYSQIVEFSNLLNQFAEQ